MVENIPSTPSAKILILTPVKDAEKHLPRYFELLSKLTYPHELVSIGVLESDSADRTFAKTKKKFLDLNKAFRKVSLWQKDFDFKIPASVQRWEKRYQIARRGVLAKSRNHLLFRALTDEDWVLWIDVDVIDYPPDVIERLIRCGKEIVQPNCVLEYGGKSFDLNAWRDNGEYHLHDLRKEGDLVKLHAIGGTMLLVQADLHRDGLIFPPYLYGLESKLIRKNNHLKRRWGIFPQKTDRGEIETEGLGMMAADMGFECWGMPNLEIKHYPE